MTGLDRRLMTAVRRVSVAADCRSATVGRHEVSAAEPALLRQPLAAALYAELHAGCPPAGGPPGRPRGALAFEKELAALLPDQVTTRRATLIAASEQKALVRLDGVRLWVPRADVVADGLPPVPGTPVSVRMAAARPALAPGFFYADSGQDADRVRPGQPVLRVYVHLITMAAAIQAWGAVLGLLSGLGTGYRAKVVSGPGQLPRRDGLVVYLPACAAGVPQRIAAATTGVRGIGRRVSAYAEPLAPGVAIAWEPTDNRPGMRGMSFGEHRSSVLADALLQHAEWKARGTNRPLAAVIPEVFTAACIDPGHPARNTP
jgi:hypothetical protein